MIKLLVCFCTLTLSLTAMADIALVYRGNNHWVSTQDNAPLQKLVALAKKGQKNYSAEFPKNQPDVSAERLLVLQSILEKYTHGPVLITANESADIAMNSLLFKE